MSDYEKLKAIINEANDLLSHGVTSEAPAFVAWYNKINRFLISYYGENSYEYNDFQKCYFSPTVFFGDDLIYEEVKACKKGLAQTIAVLTTYLDDFDEEVKDKEQNACFNSKDVFIVHGHDNNCKNEVEMFIRRIGLNPIILSNQPSEGATIIEKIESYTNVGFALVLYTACDLGKVNDGDADLKYRARQNVVFEHGYLMAKLGREKVLALVASEDIETPSDLSGVVYVQMGDNWKTKVKRELRSCGLEFDELGD